MPALHAAVGGSAIARILRCPGSVALAAKLPHESSAAADRGTLLHHAMEAMIRCKREPHEMIGHAFEGLAVEAREAKALLLPARAMLLRFMGKAVPHLEVRVRLADRVWGTADVLGCHAGVGYLADFKFGTWEVDPASEQNKFYAAAAFEGGHFTEGPREVRTAVIQPAVSTRLRPVNYTPEELSEFAERVRAVAKVALAPNAPVIPGEKQCEWCPVKKARACPALNSGAANLIEAFERVRFRI